MTADQTAPLIKVSAARCRIGRHGVLTVDDFSVRPGQQWCVFGPNGAGKSLLADLIAGNRIESGSYVSYADGFDPRRDIHVVSFEEQQRLWQQDNRLDMSEYSARAEDPGTTVAALVRSTRSPDTQDQALLETLLRELDLSTLLEQGIRFLSSGQVRRALIARALYARREGIAQLLILDDPLESIDRDSRQRIARCIRNYLRTDVVSLQLCRRAGDILPGVTHLALMDELALKQQGAYQAMAGSDVFRAMQARRAVLPAALPAPAPDSAADAPDATLPYIELEGVGAAYGKNRVLQGIDWTMTAEHHVLIEGPNGCGKSTLLSLIDGENHKAYGQRVRLFGRQRGSGETVWQIKARFGLVSNELHNRYVKGWRVLDVVVSGFFDSLGLYDDSGAGETERARQWLEALGIAALASHYYHEISFGQQRLVLLARAMVKQPSILILDEPCVGLDDFHRDLILRLLDLIAEQTATRIIYVSHVQGEQPRCINQRLRFIAGDDGAYTVEQAAV